MSPNGDTYRTIPWSFTQPSPSLPEGRNKSSLRCWRFQRTKLSGWGARRSCSFLGVLSRKKCSSLNTASICAGLRQRGGKACPQEDKQQHPPRHCGVLLGLCRGLAGPDHVVSLGMYEPLYAWRGGRPRRPFTAQSLPPCSWGRGQRLQAVLLRGRVQVATWAGGRVMPHPGKPKARLIQNTVIVAGCPLLLGNNFQLYASSAKWLKHNMAIRSPGF